MIKRRQRDDQVATVLTTARKYLGYTAEVLGRTSFGERTGYQSQPWAGAFIDVVLRESGLRTVPSFVYTPAALAEFLRSGLVTTKPQPGDIAIFNFASTAASAFTQPHAGIVTDVRHLKKTGMFTTIEGNTTGQSSYQDKDGVHQKVRHLTDVVIFCRIESKGPKLLTKIYNKLSRSGPDKLDIQELEEAARLQESISAKLVRPGTKNKSIKLVQLALSTVVDINGCEPGKWDAATASAFARYQRNIGRVGSDASGLPEVNTLKRLAAESGIFKIDE
jgi:hypothetical protein